MLIILTIVIEYEHPGADNESTVWQRKTQSFLEKARGMF
jgi:hypothetical protein